MMRIGLLLLALLASAANASVSYSASGLRKPNHNKYVACYFQSWAIFRNGNGVFQPSDIKPEYCTHLIYAFAGLDADSWEIKSLDHWADLNDPNGKDGYRKLTQLRFQYPGLKVSLAIGGWNEQSRNYSEMAKDSGKRRRFVQSVVHFLRAYNFQGLDFDWEWPTSRGGGAYDKYNFVLLLKELREAFDKHNFLLTAAISAHHDRDSLETRYDVRRMSEYLDYIHLMTYDYHAGHNVVMPNAPLDDVNKTISLMLETGVPPKKMILGLPIYGRGYILEEPLRSPHENPLGRPSLRDSWAGDYSNEKGVLGYNEICKHLMLNQSWIQKWDNMSDTPYAVFQNKVIVYDNARSLHDKIQLALQKGFGGVFVWSIDTDDFRGDCIPMNKRNRVDVRDYQYPMMQAITSALERGSSGSASCTSAAFVLLLLALFNGLRSL